MTAGEIAETAAAQQRAANGGGGPASANASGGAGAGRPTANGPRSELELLHARVAELEAELVEISARCNAAVAEAQAQTYWLERWHVDLNELMRRPGAEELRLTLRAIRSILRSLRRLKRRLRS
jgi:hypothetical protein